MTPDTDDDSRRYGLWPSLVGFVLGFAVVGLMFGLATGMH
jgi:hypothetical protein